jgi:predicted nucleic acid-binding protein
MAVPAKKFLVVDACVIAEASKHSTDDKTWKAVDILSRILYVCHKIVLDYEDPEQDNIIDEYERQATSTVTKSWIQAMQFRGDKIVYRGRSPLSFPALTDPHDEKYLQVAVNSPHKIVISEDSDLTDLKNDPQLVNNGINIWSFDVALRNL